MSVLSNEQQLVILLSKSRVNEIEIRKIRELLATHMDWSQVIGLLQYHRLVGVAWRNINRYIIETGREKCIFPNFFSILRGIYNFQKIKAGEQKKYTVEVCRKFEDKGIQYALLKGIVLAENIYEDLGARDFKDNDILVNPKQINDCISILKELGYIQGLTNIKKQNITEIERKDKIMWQLGSHEVFPFKKSISENPFLRYHIIDLHFSIELMSSNRNDIAVKEILNRSIKVNVKPTKLSSLQWEDKLIFLCLHFYKEATTYNEVLNYNDLLLYKIIDIYNLIINDKIEIDWGVVLNRVDLLNITGPVYYALYYTNLIHSSTIPDCIMQKLEKNNKLLLDQVFFYNSKKLAIEWEGDILQRIFNANRPKKVANISRDFS